MRTKKTAHIQVSKFEGCWWALLHFPHESVLLGTNTDLEALVEDCELNSTFDRKFPVLVGKKLDF